jgi:putative ATP-binding cassette transporter
VTQSVFAFAQVHGAFSLIVTQFETLSTFAAVTDRLNTIAGAIEQARTPTASAIEIVENDELLAYEGLVLWTPKDRHVLLRDLALTVPGQHHLLILGPNVAAKQALFVATAGIWEDGEGRIVRPHRDRIQFVPHQPFLMRSTLRERLLLTLRDRSFSDDELLDALRKIGLTSALERIGGLDALHDWTSALSRGEQHLISIARLLLARPRFAFLEETTEALGPEQVEQVYQALSEASITYLTIGENHHLRSYHNGVLELFDDGQWNYTATRDTASV